MAVLTLTEPWPARVRCSLAAAFLQASCSAHTRESVRHTAAPQAAATTAGTPTPAPSSSTLSNALGLGKTAPSGASRGVLARASSCAAR